MRRAAVVAAAVAAVAASSTVKMSPRTEARSILNRSRKPLPKPKMKATTSSFGETHQEGGLSANLDEAETETRTELLEAFDELSNGRIGEYFSMSSQLGSPITEQAELVRQAYIAQRRLLKITPHTREPGPKILKQLLEATEETIKACLASTENAGDSEALMIALGGVAEGAKSLAWVSLGMCWRSEQKRNPFDYVEGCITTAKHEWFDGIFDKKDPTWCAWAQAFLDAMEELHAYVGKYHKEEMAWGAVKNKSRSMTFWSNALAQTAPGEGKADAYEYSTKLGIPITKSAA